MTRLIALGSLILLPLALAGCGNLATETFRAGMKAGQAGPSTATSTPAPSATAAPATATTVPTGVVKTIHKDPPAELVPTLEAAATLVAATFTAAAQVTATATPIPPSATPTPIPPTATPAEQPATGAATEFGLMQPTSLQPAKVVNVVDGDTVDVLIDGQEARLRLIGLDTPETKDPRKPVQCYGKEASAQAEQLLAGENVLLESDPSQDERDRYDRLLRYVWLPDGRLYNLEMIDKGFAHEYTYSPSGPYKYQVAFKAAEQEARENNRGFWAPDTCAGDTEQPSERPTATPEPPVPAPKTAPSGGESRPFPKVPDVGAAPCEPGQIKGNRNSKIYHSPGQRDYAKTQANVACFDTAGEAQAAGYRAAKR